MAPLWGQSRVDRDRMLSAVRTLGTTSVPGLAAVLSVSERKAERWVREAVRERVSGLRFNPVIQSVWWEEPVAPPPPPPAPMASREPVPAAGPAPPLPAFSASGRAPVRPTPPTIAEGESRAASARRCGSCRILMVPTGTGESFCCPQCGRITSRMAAEPAPPVAMAPHELPLAAIPASSGPLVDDASAESGESADRRTQELLAAWVLGRPIPCPKCRSSLHHRGFGEYACPGCGEQVRFSVSGGFASSVGRTPGGTPENGATRLPAVAAVSPGTNPS